MLGMRIYTYLKGELVGEDEFGNRYYRKRGSQISLREKRWVIYKGEEEASKVPAEWHGWLHHTFPFPMNISVVKRYPWQKTHLPNLTGTSFFYRPSGHISTQAQRHSATGDYESWTPA